MEPMEQRKPYRIVLVPFPMTALAAFGYYLLRRVSLVGKDTLTFFDWLPNRRTARPNLDEEQVFYLFGPGSSVQNRLLEIIKRPLAEEREILSRFLTFCQSPNRLNLQHFQKLLRVLNADLCDPACALEEAVRIFSVWVGERLNPISQELTKVRYHITQSAGLGLAPPELRKSRLYLPIPRFRDAKPTTRAIIGAEDVDFFEGNLHQLRGQHLLILIGGPPKSGKSTACASLVHRMRSIIRSIKSRKGWRKLALSVRYVDLDLGTPTVETVLEQGRAQQKDLQRLKIPWTQGLADEALQKAVEARRKYNIVVGDLPGGKPDSITAWISVAGDASHIFTGDWSRIGEWRSFFKSVGVTCIGEARTRSRRQSRNSFVRRYRPGKFIGARISGLDLVVSPWNPVIEFIAHACLFDILPATMEHRRRQVALYLQKYDRK